MAQRGVEWVFRLIDRVTGPAKRITKSLGSVGSKTQQVQRQSSILGTAIARSLGISERQAVRLSTAFRGIALSSQGLQVARMRAERLRLTLAGLARRMVSFPSLITAGAAGILTGNVLGAAGYKESTVRALQIMQGSDEKGSATFERARAFAAVNPLSTKQVLESWTKLLGAKFSESDVPVIMRGLADATAFTGFKPEVLESLTRAITQIKQKGVLSIEELHQIAETGLPIGQGVVFEQIAKVLNITPAQVAKLQEQGRISADLAIFGIMGAIEDNITRGPLGSLAQKLADTLFGQWQIFKSRPFEFFMDLDASDGFASAKRLLKNLNALTDTETETGKRFKQLVLDSFGGTLESIFGPLADATDPARIEATVNRIVAWLERIKVWWARNGPAIRQQVLEFGAGVGQGFRDVLDILHLLGSGARWLTSLFQPLSAAQGDVTAQSGRLFGRLAFVGVALSALNTLTLGLVSRVLRWLWAGARWLVGLQAVQISLRMLGARLLTLGGVLLRFVGGPWGIAIAAVLSGAWEIYRNWEKVGPKLEKWWKGFGKWAEGAWGSLIDAGADGLQSLRTVPRRFDALFRGLWEPVVSATDTAWQWVVDQVFAAWNWLRGIPDNLKQWFANLWGDFSTNTREVWDSAKSEVEEIVLWFESLPQRFFEIGQNMLQSLANGINSALASVQTAITNAGNKTIQWFRDVLGMNSPSKVFLKLGYGIPQGAQQGIMRGQPLVNKAMAALTAATLGIAPVTAQTAIGSVGAQPPAATATLATSTVAAPASSTSSRAARATPAVQVQITINDARDPDRVLEQLRQRFPVLVAEAFEQLALEEGSSG